MRLLALWYLRAMTRALTRRVGVAYCVPARGGRGLFNACVCLLLYVAAAAGVTGALRRPLRRSNRCGALRALCCCLHGVLIPMAVCCRFEQARVHSQSPPRPPSFLWRLMMVLLAEATAAQLHLLPVVAVVVVAAAAAVVNPWATILTAPARLEVAVTSTWTMCRRPRCRLSLRVVCGRRARGVSFAALRVFCACQVRQYRSCS